jgi:hypothetical protein
MGRVAVQIKSMGYDVKITTKPLLFSKVFKKQEVVYESI